MSSHAVPRARLEPLEKRTFFAVVNGLTGAYFHNANLTDAAGTRVDANVNFDWAYGSPAANIQADTFSARWTGQVQAKSSGTYTFYTTSDDGVRLWVDGKLIIDRWQNQSATEHAGTIALVGGQRYSLKLEYFENTGRATARLRWSGPGVLKEIIPSSHLFTETTTTTAPATPSGLVAMAKSSSAIVLEWNDVANETGYKIERRRDGTTDPWTQIATVGANVARYENGGLASNTTYLYRIRAYNAAGNSAYSPVAWATTPNTPLPPPPPPPPPPAGQTPFKGSPFSITKTAITTIQAEDFDNGGQGVAFNDTTAGNLGGAYRSTAVDIAATTDTGGGHLV